MRTMLLTLGVLLALAGCGHSDGVSEEDRVQTAIERYFRATAAGDGKIACQVLTDQARHGFAGILDGPPARDCATNVREVARISKPLRSTSVSQIVVNYGRATAYVTSASPAYSNSVQLVREGDSWKLLYLPTAIHRFQFPRIFHSSHGGHH